MGAEWRETTVGEFSPFAYGKNLPEKKRENGPYRVYGSNGPVGFHNKPLVEESGIVIGRKGTVGAVHYTAQPFWPIDTTFYVSRANHRDLRYTYYLLKSLGLENMNSDSAVPGLSRDAAHARKILVPELDEQRAIAHILGSLDDNIELNRRMNQALEGMARAIFKSWFVDFDPVRAKAEGRPTGLPDDIAALFPDSFENSELGEIPKGWEVVVLPEIIDVNPARKLKKGQIAPYLEMKNAPENTARALHWYYREYGSGVKFINGDVLMARITPCLENGKGAFVDFLEADQVGWGSTEYIVFRSKKPLPLEYSYFLSRTNDFRSYSIVNMTGSSGRQRVPATVFDSYLVVNPSREVCDCFGMIAGAIMSKIKKNDEEAHTLASLRDTLLPKLISGELRVPDAEKFVEEAGL
ncbi:MAG TPA: restriction endonuclease subunit S [Desulfobacteraceae bacterium]|nr:restriction endonuclease subunit S [Desulfobacteraceae bacterium]